ncbi:DNA repair endonuclease XPF [Amphibalanus amphitrite]|uniref:DNA repair endonuclease XPF n=1 Tax=Amphibalanus amphitrite TaxID=1232801 RepID=A0A6A4WJA6_AMPAM|nr:DNA repair endonuclease XPF [Amphibalanus amphitrite]
MNCVCAVWGDYAIQSIRGEVDAGNYTYYKLQWDGPVTIVLESLSGDADLYVSKTLLKPTFDPEEFDFSSTTCGRDWVDIPRACPRPLGVAVYGHPRQPSSSYELHLVYRDPDYLDQFTLHPENDTEDELLGTLRKRAGAQRGSAETETNGAAGAAEAAAGAAEAEEGTEGAAKGGETAEAAAAGAAAEAAAAAISERVQATVTSGALLSYETQMLLELLAEDGLLVSARGLGLERLVTALVRVHCDPGQLVLVMGTGRPEEEYIVERLAADGVSPLPRTVTADTSVSERRQVYLQGGVLFVTSRILVVDLLTERCPADLVTGLVVYRAHAVVESAQEAFILRLYRQKNKTGFIKAFSSSPLSFTSGFCQVQRVMRNLFVRNLYLWPRFHLQVNQTLKECAPEVVEIRLKMTPLMMSIQTALLDLINITCKEFRRLNPSLDWDSLTAETVLSRSFHKVTRHRLDPVWNQLSARTRQLASDLRTLRSLLLALPQLDSCSFYQLVAAQQTAERALNSGWAILDAAETVFVDARRRVFGDVQPQAKRAVRAEGKRPQPKVLTPEEPPRWPALSEVLSEIRAEVAAAAAADESQDLPPLWPDKVLIVASDMAACRRIREFLTLGSEAALWRRFQLTLASRYDDDAFIPSAAVTTAPTTAQEKAPNKDGDQQTLTQMGNADPKTSAGGGTADDDELLVSLPDSPLLLLLPTKDANDPFQLQRSLHLYRPRYVVLYDLDVAVIRSIEVHQAATPERQLRVYTLLFSGTSEEQAYLTALRTEKQAFEYLISEKASMVVPEEREGRDDTNADLERGAAQPEPAAASSRRGGAAPPPPAEPPRVIVDMREFRSELPSLLHRRGLEIVPATIEVGDYIVTPELCVERKSVSDLIGSLMSGRLYGQALAMSRHYRRPLLLIEFDQSKPFTLQGKYYLSSDMSSAQVVSRLQLLTLHFPRLRLMWCPSPYASAELLHQLKEGAGEPSLAEARSATADRTDTLAEDRVNPQVRDFVSKLPGVRQKTLYALLNKIDSLLDLLEMSEEALSEVLGSPTDASQLHQALHGKLSAPAPGDTSAAKRPATTTTAGRGRAARPRFWRGKKKS